MKQLLTVLVGLLLTNSVVHAQANNTVNHLANPFEKAIEKITLFLKFTNDAKTDYLLFILEKRVAELVYTVTANNLDDIEPVASRYATYTQSIAGFVIQNHLVTKKDKLVSQLIRHKTLIENLQRNYKFESGWWLAIQHDTNTIDNTLKRLEDLK